MIGYGRAVYEVARKEALQHLRTKRLLIFGIIFLLSLVLLTVIVPAAFFDLSEAQGDEYVHNGLFALFLILPLIGGVTILTVLSITLTADGVCSEWQRRTIFLLLSRPVPRSAFVLGKLVGSAVPLALMFIVAAILDYLLVSLVVGSGPHGMEALRFLGALGLAALGIASYSALGLFFSTLTRSSVPSFLFSFLVAIILLPIVASIGSILYAVDADNAFDAGREPPDPEAAKYTWSRYLDPQLAFRSMAPVLTPGEGEGFLDFFGGGGDVNVVPVIAASLAWTALFTTAALVAVRRRDFE